MQNYKLLTLANIDVSYRELGNGMRVGELRVVAESLIGNLDRVMSLASFPGRLSALLVPMSMADMWRDEPGHRLQPLAEFFNVSGRASKRLSPKDRKELGPCEPFTSEELNAIERGDLVGGEKPLAALEDGLETLDEAVRMSGDYVSKAVDAMLSSMVVGTWTAFETLAGDLWVATLNAHPRDLDRLKGEEKRIHKAARKHREAYAKGAKLPPDKPNARQQEGEKEIQIKAIREITEGGYDLSARMGDLLKAKVDFTTLYETRRAYSLAFDYRTVGKNVTDAVDKALANTALDALSQVRNVIVHRAGIADAEYDNNRETLPTMPQVGEGQPVALDGASVMWLVSPVIECCVSILTSIDEWLDSGSSPSGCGAGI